MKTSTLITLFLSLTVASCDYGPELSVEGAEGESFAFGQFALEKEHGGFNAEASNETIEFFEEAVGFKFDGEAMKDGNAIDNTEETAPGLEQEPIFPPCPKGLMEGYWQRINTSGGIFYGKWVNASGNITGRLGGIWGRQADGQRLVYGMYVDSKGNFKGYLKGNYNPLSNADFDADMIVIPDGEFKGVWLDKSLKHRGDFGGNYFEAGSNGIGSFHGKWHERCPPIILPPPPPPEVCVPDCEDKVCGDDGCGGSCGECDENAVCYDSGTCHVQKCFKAELGGPTSCKDEETWLGYATEVCADYDKVVTEHTLYQECGEDSSTDNASEAFSRYISFECCPQIIEPTDPAIIITMDVRWGWFHGPPFPKSWTVWNGGISVDGGTLHLDQVINWDKHDMINPAVAINEFTWQSKTGPHNDGVRATVAAFAPDSLVTIETAVDTLTFTAESLAIMDVVLVVDDFGNEIRISSAEILPL